MQLSFTSLLSTGAIAAMFISGAVATPVASSELQTRGPPGDMAICWAKGNDAPDRDMNLGSNTKCRKAWARGDSAGEGEMKSFSGLYFDAENFDKFDLKKMRSVGPWHCCSHCDNDTECVGWQFTFDAALKQCFCHLVKVKSCAASTGLAFRGPLSIGNDTGIYHPSTSQGKCQLK